MLGWILVTTVSIADGPPVVTQGDRVVYETKEACEDALLESYLVEGWKAERSGRSLSIYTFHEEGVASMTCLMILDRVSP